MTADIIPSLLKSIDNYPLCVIQVDDLFITGMAAELATNPNIPRTDAKHIKLFPKFFSNGCKDVCLLYKTPILYDCKTVGQYNIFWSNWKNSTYEKCFPGIPMQTTLESTRKTVKPMLTKMTSIQKIYMKIQKTDQIQDSSNELILILVVIIIVLLLKRWKKVLKNVILKIFLKT